jgi:hypothetical protein
VELRSLFYWDGVSGDRSFWSCDRFLIEVMFGAIVFFGGAIAILPKI